MLPFIKKQRQVAGISMEYRKPDDAEKAKEINMIEIAMRDFCDAEEKKDYKGMAIAFKAAFDMLESMPHEEYEHEDDEE